MWFWPCTAVFSLQCNSASYGFYWAAVRPAFGRFLPAWCGGFLSEPPGWGPGGSSAGTGSRHQASQAISCALRPSCCLYPICNSHRMCVLLCVQAVFASFTCLVSIFFAPSPKVIRVSWIQGSLDSGIRSPKIQGSMIQESGVPWFKSQEFLDWGVPWLRSSMIQDSGCPLIPESGVPWFRSPWFKSLEPMVKELLIQKSGLHDSGVLPTQVQWAWRGIYFFKYWCFYRF